MIKEINWIETERLLPQRGKRVLISTWRGFVGEAIMTESGIDNSGEKYTLWRRYGVESRKIIGQDVIAWAELPEAYPYTEVINDLQG